MGVGVIGETGVNGEDVTAFGTKLLNSYFMASCAAGLNSCGLSEANGLALMLLWKPVLAAKGLNLGQNIVLLSTLKGV